MSGEVRTRDAETRGNRLRRYLGEIASLVTRRDRHQERLAAVDTRISVSGTRGKSTMTRWLHDTLVGRDIDTYAKVTGTEPISVYNGREWAIPRSGRTTLYENEREIRRFAPMDAIVVENQGITPYTTRLVNTRYVEPTIVVVTNVREDHLDTLGGNRERIARALARSIPDGTHVICGEQGHAIRRYFARELDNRGATVTFVDVPAEYDRIPGAELVYCADETLREVTGRGLDRERAARYLDSLRVEWERLPWGRVFDAASVNDVQSTEAVRRALVGDSDEVIQPVVYLRRDRPGRTASFVRYLDKLAAEGHIEQARVVDGHVPAFKARTSFPVLGHPASEEPESILRDALLDGWPVVLMGNATPPFMQEMRDLIDHRRDDGAAHAPGEQRPSGESVRSVAADGAQVLVLDRTETSSTDDLCIDLLTAREADRSLFVSLGRPPEEQLAKWHERGTAIPDQLGILTPEGDGPTARPDGATAPGPASKFVTTAADFTGVVQALLAEFGDAGTHPGTGVCVDSLGPLLQEYDLEAVFQALHVVTHALSGSGVTAHYHLTTASHDERTIGTLEPLFDTIVTINEHGERRVHAPLAAEEEEQALESR